MSSAILSGERREESGKRVVETISDLETQQEPAAVRAYRMLEHLIVTHRLLPGSTTTEGALIQLVGLGRTPVREAIQRLAWEGLVEVRPRAGLAIADLHPADWLQIIDARSGIEVTLSKAAARRLDARCRELLQQAAAGMTEARSSGDVAAFLKADKQLDEAIAAAAGNPFATRAVAPLQTHSRRFWYRYHSSSGLMQSTEKHLRLARSIMSGGETQAGLDAAQLMKMLRGLAEDAARL